ncbi:MAG: hypothetical protein E7447_01230 [Ruminococcaceae bacterium]|nr:hypothetical protein [Oscillospiraceae bacterium]
MENKEDFSYTYSAAQQQEVAEIRKKYLPREENKMERLRKLHAIPTQKAQAASLTLGVIGALIMGTGMSMVMTDIGAILGNWSMVIAVIVGIVGMVIAALAYPLYNRVLRSWREKIAPEILRLTDELLQG